MVEAFHSVLVALVADLARLLMEDDAQIDSEKSGEITSEQLAEWKAKFGA